METISTYTSRLVAGDVVIDYGQPARVLDATPSNTPGLWMLTLDHRGNDLALTESALVREHDAVWEVATSAHTVHVGDTVRIGNGAVEHLVTGFAPDGRARLNHEGRWQSRRVDRLVVVHQAADVDNEDRAIDHLVPEVSSDEEPASQEDVKRVREQVTIVVELRVAAQQAYTRAAAAPTWDRAEVHRRDAELFSRAADVIVRAAD